jgi:hypothetical protein
MGDKDKAIEALEELLQLNSSNTNYYLKVLEVHGFDNKNFDYTPE